MSSIGLVSALLLRPSLVLAVAAVLAYALRGARAATRHALWFGVLVATLLLPVFTVTLSEFRVTLPLRDVAVSWTEPPLPLGVAHEPAARATADATPAPEALPQSSLKAVDPARVLFAFWLIGAVLLVARRGTAEVVAGRTARRGRRVSVRVERLRYAVAQQTGASARTRICFSAEVAAPVVTGLLRPMVLLPAAADSWSDAELRAVLAHELAHAARFDCLLNFCADIATACYWCNPLVRITTTRMRLEGERACDDAVLRTGADPEGYARLLLKLARAANPAARFVPAATAMARWSQLEARLLRVVDGHVARAPLPHRRAAALACTGLLIALPAAAISLSSAEPPVQSAVESSNGAAPMPVFAPELPGDSIDPPRSELIPLDPAAYIISTDLWRRVTTGPDAALGAQLVQALTHEPLHEADLVRDRAAWALAQAGPDGSLVGPLMEALGATDWRVQSHAAWALALTSDARAVPRLVSLLEHPVWRVRAMAAYALANSAEDRARAGMLAALSDPAWQVRLEAVEYFALRPEPQRPITLRERLQDAHIAVRDAAARAISQR